MAARWHFKRSIRKKKKKKKKKKVNISLHLLYTSFEPTPGIRASWLIKSLDHLVSEGHPPRSLPACEPGFIAWCPRRPIIGMPTESSYFCTCCAWVSIRVRSSPLNGLDLVWFGLMAYQPLNVIQCQIHFYTYKQFKQFSLTYKNVLFQTILFSIRTQFSSIWPIDRILSDATTPGQSGLGSDGNEGVLRIPQRSSITRASPSDCLVSYLGHSLGGYLSTEIKSVYSIAPADWAIKWPWIILWFGGKPVK